MRGNSMKSLGLLFIGSGFATMAGAWSKTLSGPDDGNGNAVQQTADGGYVIAGSTESYGAGGLDVWLIKTDANGVMQWNRTFGGSAEDDGWSAQQTADGGYIITGRTDSFGAGGFDAWLIKTDANGNGQWEKTFGGSADDVGWSAQQTADGGYVISGSTESYGAGGLDVWLIKTDANGVMQWNRTFGGSADEECYAVQQTADGGYVITGDTASYGAGLGDVWLLKTDANGNEQWNRTFGGSADDVGGSVQQTADGGYVITGAKDASSVSGPYDDIDGTIWLIKTNANGNEQWDRTFGGSGRGSSVQQTADGGYVISGSTASYGASGSDAWLIKTDANGNEQWKRTFGGSELDFGLSAQQTSDGGYIFTGSTNSFGAGYFDVLLIKTDANGNWE